MDDVHSGACLCGSVRFRARGPLREVVFCHCSQCRRQTGLFYAATNVDMADVKLDGEEHIGWYRASDFAARGFCRTCGSALFWKANSSNEISIMAGAFDEPDALEPGCHIFCADKAAFYAIDDGLPHYDRGSPGLVVADP